MKVYIRSDEGLDENDPLVQYYDFCLDHQKEIDDYFKPKAQEYFGSSVHTYDCSVDLEYRSIYKDEIVVRFYACADIEDHFSTECAEFVEFNDDTNGHDVTWKYDNNKFTVEIHDTGYIGNGTYDHTSLDAVYDEIDYGVDTILNTWHTSGNVVSDCSELIDDIQYIYDNFINDVDLQFTIFGDVSAYVCAYDKSTGYAIYKHRIRLAFVQTVIDELSKCVEQYIYSDNNSVIEADVIVKYNKKIVKVKSQLLPFMEKISTNLQRQWDCLSRVHREMRSGQQLEFNIACRDKQDLQEIVDYIEDNLYQYDVSIEVHLNQYDITKLGKQFLRIYGE